MSHNNHDFIVDTESEESFEDLLNKSFIEPRHLDPGERVEADIIKITKEWVFIDLGGKSEGYIERSEFLDSEGNITIKEGEKINAYFLSSRHNEMLFTTRLAGGATSNRHLEDAYRNRIPVEGLVETEIKGGFDIKIAGNTRAFCPYSQLGLQRVMDNQQYIGMHLVFMIIEYDEMGRNIIVSHRAVLEEERQRQKEVLRDSLKEGDSVSGEITAIRTFGAFIDIGGIEGLIPVSEIAWGRVDDINSALSIGQKVDVIIKKLDWENDKFSFSLKEIQPDPWSSAEHKYPEGSRHQGIVSRLAPFGAFVTLEPGIDGLIPVSELAKGKKIRHAREVLEEKQVVEVRINKVDKEAKRLSLTIYSGESIPEEVFDYKQYVSSNRNASSGSLGTLGDLFKGKINKG